MTDPPVFVPVALLPAMATLRRLLSAAAQLEATGLIQIVVQARCPAQVKWRWTTPSAHDRTVPDPAVWTLAADSIYRRVLDRLQVLQAAATVDPTNGRETEHLVVGGVVDGHPSLDVDWGGTVQLVRAVS